MTVEAPTLGNLVPHAQILVALGTSLLNGLAKGEFDKEIVVTEEILAGLGIVLPPPDAIDEAANILLFLNSFPSVHRSRYDPETGYFID